MGYRSDDIFSVYPETLVIGPSLTALVTALPGQISVTLKYGSGGTLWFLGSSMTGGCTFASTQQYLIGGSEIFNMANSGQFRLGTTGATVICYLARGRTASFDQT